MSLRPESYGAEHEWGDHPLRRPLPSGFGRDVKDYTIVNSNGIANDPKGKLYQFGGEINTRPTAETHGQAEILLMLKDLYPEAVVNYRSNLHLHIRVPGLRDDLDALKRVQGFVHTVMPHFLNVIEPIPTADETHADASLEEWAGARRRHNRRKVSHHTLLTEGRLQHQLGASNIDEFFRREVPFSRAGTPQWHFQPRLCVNLRQLRETDTVEFRHFPGTLDDGELLTAMEWCKDFMEHALGGYSLQDLTDHFNAYYAAAAFPKFPRYEHWMEERYRRTCHDGTLSRAEIERNIHDILAEDATNMERTW